MDSPRASGEQQMKGWAICQPRLRWTIWASEFGYKWFGFMWRLVQENRAYDDIGILSKEQNEMQSNPAQWSMFVHVFMFCISESTFQQNRHIPRDKSASCPNCLSSHSSPSLTACEPCCDVITHRKFLIKLVREGKKLVREGEKQRELWWEFEMADEKKQRGYPSQGTLLCFFFGSASWLTLSLIHYIQYHPPHGPSKKNMTPSAHFPFSCTWSRNFPLWLTLQHSGALLKWRLCFSAYYYESLTHRKGGV